MRESCPVAASEKLLEMSLLHESEKAAGASHSSLPNFAFEMLSSVEEEEEECLEEEEAECLQSVMGTLLLSFQEIKAMVDGTEVRLESYIAERFGGERVSRWRECE